MPSTNTPEDYFETLLLLFRDTEEVSERYLRLQNLLHTFFRDQCPQERSFPNLFARISFLCTQSPKALKAFSEVRVHARKALQKKEEIKIATLENDIRLFASGIAELLQKTPPAELKTERACFSENNLPDKTNHIRAVYTGKEENILHAVPHDREDSEKIKIIIREYPEEKSPFSRTIDLLTPGMQINLLDIKELPDGIYSAGIIVLEPDFLIDISSLAECFRPYGAHPLNFLLSRLGTDKNSRHILLGNIVNGFLDDLINETDEAPADYLRSMQKAFRCYPLQLTACDELSDSSLSNQFFTDCRTQFGYLCRIVREEFSGNGIDKKKALLEPAFICEALGLQGRLDLLCDDLSALIELKSGKAQELLPGKITYSENHYVQMLLYLAVLKYNLQTGYGSIQPYLLYSKYPELYPMAPYRRLIKEAIGLRNEIVANEYGIQQQNDPAFSREIIHSIRPGILNRKGLNNTLWNRFLKPEIDRFSDRIQKLSPIEKDYFMALFTFITKEQYTAKAGEANYDSVRGMALLWNGSETEKLDAGELIAGLRIIENSDTGEEQRLCFSFPESNSIPNFRNGDSVVLYRRERPSDNVCSRQIFKGSIERIVPGQLVLRLRTRQQNKEALPQNGVYAIERDYPDTGFTSMFKGLGYFLHAGQDRKNLLLSQREPETDHEIYHDLLSEAKDDIDRTVAKALSAKDYFLLVGPPGTGKTSQALSRIVRKCLNLPGQNILLLAYTNKAVDEICHSLIQIDKNLPFIRLGQETSCDEKFRDRLLKNKISGCGKRNEVARILKEHRIFVSTLTTLSQNMVLFRIKYFETAIIDEASQILEPQIAGILSATGSNGTNAIGRFILIGDHKQLPAVVLQSETDSKISVPALQSVGITDLRESLFQRLYRYETREEHESSVTGQLFLQGRMHPEIEAFPSEAFYNGLLKPFGLPHQTEPLEPINLTDTFATKVLSKRLSFVPVTERNGSSYKTNLREAELSARLIRAILLKYAENEEKFYPETQLGIITPYRNQIAAIRQQINKAGIGEAEQITIDTVERFQGGQRDIIIFSCCVNTPFQLQFLCSSFEENGKTIDRKLNVALTRARKQLVILGNPELLSRNPVYRKLLEHIEKQNGIVKPE